MASRMLEMRSACESGGSEADRQLLHYVLHEEAGQNTTPFQDGLMLDRDSNGELLPERKARAHGRLVSCHASTCTGWLRAKGSINSSSCAAGRPMMGRAASAANDCPTLCSTQTRNSPT